MGHEHSHSAAGQHRRPLAVAFALTAAFFVIELCAGFTTGSLALLGDAGHMGGDVIALGAALAASVIASRPDRTGQRTFGSYRAEVFASGLASAVMLLSAIYVVVEAVKRFSGDEHPASGVMLAVGLLGLVMNVACMLVLRAGAGESLNVRGAYAEVVSDALGSVGVIVAAVLVRFTGAPWWDVVVAVAIAVFVAWRALALAREVLAVLGQHAPADVDVAAVEGALRALPAVQAVHDLHVWQLTSGMKVVTVHLVATGEHTAVLRDAQRVLADGFGMPHATVQVESIDDAECVGPEW